MGDDILTTEEVRAALRYKSVETVRRNAGKLGGFRLPGSTRWLFRREVIEGLTFGDQGAGAR